MKGLRLFLTLGVVFGGGLAWACGAVAQQVSSSGGTEGGGDIQEITVTAQRVSEPLQKTPASISVLSADTLESAGVQNLTDVSRLIAGFTFNEGYRAGVPQISMRGIPTVQGGEAPAAFIVDGVQAPALDFINQDLLDIANVQVLRGPQGGLYGRNAIGGAVVIETQRPTDEFHDTLTINGGNGGYFRAVNTASGPIIPGALWAKLTLQAKHFDGLIQNTATGEPADFNKDYAGRLEIVAKPTDTTTVDLTWSHTQGIDGASYLNVVPGSTIGDPKQYDKVDFNLPTVDHRHMSIFTAKLDQETPLGTLSSISQYANSQSCVCYGEADWTPAAVVTAYNPVKVTAVNEDVHLASPTDQAVQWIIGGFYQWRQTTNDLNVYFEETPGGNPYCNCAGGPAYSAARDEDHSSSLAWAVYGQASVRLPANLKFDLALRYDSDKRSDEDLSIPAGPNNGISHTFQAFQPSGTLSEQFTPDLMGYVTVGKGFRSGGFNAYTDTVAGGLLVPRQYPAETNVNYEAGIKSQFLDHHLTVNADVFHTKFNNEQYFLFSSAPPARDIVSIKSVTFNGGELEVSYIPLEGLTLSASGSVADSNINSDDLDQNDLNKKSPQANFYTASASAMYRHHLWGDYNAMYRLDYNYKGPVCYDSANRYCFHPISFVNARVGLESDQYTFAIWGKNILSAREPVIFFGDAFGAGIAEQQINQPATYGVEMIARF